MRVAEAGKPPGWMLVQLVPFVERQTRMRPAVRVLAYMAPAGVTATSVKPESDAIA